MNLAYIPSPTFSKFQVGPFTIHMYAICILIGICVAVWILTTRWKRYGGTFDQILDTTLVTVPCNLVNILKVWEGGMAIFGGISVGTLVAFLWCRHKHYPFAIFADAIAPALPVAQAIGRLGNWFNQELYGWPTTLPWGLKLNDADAIGKSEICYSGAECPDYKTTLFHPTFLYEMIWNLIGAAIIIYLGHKLADRLRAGQQFAMYLMWYGLGRTWIENVRINYSTVILGLRTNVWTAIIVFVIGCILFIVLYQHGPDSKVQARQLAAVTADELERQSIEEERLRQKKSQRGNMQ